MTATIHPFTAPTKCQVGALALHPDYGLCDVAKVSGSMRTILYEVREPDPIPGTSSPKPTNDDEDLVFRESISVYEAEVDVNQLRELNLDRDLMKQPMSRILGLNTTWRHQEPTT